LTGHRDRHCAGYDKTRELVSAIEAADAMTGAAEVRLVERQFVGRRYVTTLVRDKTVAINAAVRAGPDACKRMSGGVVAAHITARLNSEVEAILPTSPTAEGGGLGSEIISTCSYAIAR
jgi:microcompartment protein CcmL/EutN